MAPTIRLVFLCLLGSNLAQSGTNGAPESQATWNGSTTGSSARARERLSVLLVSSFFSGHVIPLLAVGEELVIRGHDVSFLTTEVAGSRLVPGVVEEIGMSFISAGPDPRTRVEYEEFIYGLMGRSPYHQVNELFTLARDHVRHLRNACDHLNISRWDILIVDVFLFNLIRYLDIKWGAKIITSVAAAHDYASIESQWPSPSIYCVQCTENMSFFQRFLNSVFYKNTVLRYLGTQWVKSYVAGNDSVLLNYVQEDELNHLFPDEFHPSFFYSAVGVEYARPTYPGVHMLGPVIRRNIRPLEEDLKKWLAINGGSGVVYISMGTTALVTEKMAESFVAGVMATDYSVVWSLRESNQVILKNLNMDPSRFFVTSWVSQVAVFEHEAVKLAILHCGTGGVHEALYFKVPVVCIPFWYDQFSWANRLRDQGLGLVLYAHEMSPQGVTQSIRKIETGEYRERVARVSRILKHAGGAERAADLVEYYALVGYEHLIPSYVKYNWSWMVFYNADVWLVISTLLCVSLCAFCSVSVHILRKFCKCIHSSKKHKKD